MRLPLRVIDSVESEICEERSNPESSYQFGVVQLSVWSMELLRLMAMGYIGHRWQVLGL